jgi:hypothetical protein
MIRIPSCHVHSDHKPEEIIIIRASDWSKNYEKSFVRCLLIGFCCSSVDREAHLAETESMERYKRTFPGLVPCCG